MFRVIVLLEIVGDFEDFGPAFVRLHECVAKEKQEGSKRENVEINSFMVLKDKGGILFLVDLEKAKNIAQEFGFIKGGATHIISCPLDLLEEAFKSESKKFTLQWIQTHRPQLLKGL